MRSRQYPQKRRTLLDLWDKNSPLDLPYVLFGFRMLLDHMSNYVVFFHIQLYGMSRADVSAHLCFYLLAFSTPGLSLGRILPNFATDYVETLNL